MSPALHDEGMALRMWRSYQQIEAECHAKREQALVRAAYEEELHHTRVRGLVVLAAIFAAVVVAVLV